VDREWESASVASGMEAPAPSVLSLLQALPKPVNEIEISQEDIEQRERQLYSKTKTQEQQRQQNRQLDREEVNRQMQSQKKQEEELQQRGMTQVMQKGLPRPKELPAAYFKSIQTDPSVSQTDKLIAD